jgi:hypothetical protein
MSLIQGARYLPVDQDVGELVEAEDDRGDGEGDPQQQERLVGRVALEALGEGRRELRRLGAGVERGSGHEASSGWLLTAFFAPRPAAVLLQREHPAGGR